MADDPKQKNDEFWKEKLTPEQFKVARKKGTERPFTGEYWNHKGEGTYECVCCGTQLFKSDTKYDSGSGWPSFWDAIDPEKIRLIPDNSLFMQRVEVVCAKCDAHLGHLFDDGPKPSNKRYCVNSLSLKFTANKK